MKKEYTIDILNLQNIEYAPVIRLLAHHGITFEQNSTDFGMQTLVHINAKKLDSMTRRNAGRKEKSLYLSGSPFDPIYLSDIQELKKEYSMAEIAKMYHVSRATLYRRIAEAKQKGTEQLD